MVIETLFCIALVGLVAVSLYAIYSHGSVHAELIKLIAEMHTNATVVQPTNTETK